MDGRVRRSLIASTARTRQLVAAVRRIYDQTNRQLEALQTENERAASLCQTLPQRFRAAMPLLREPERIAGRIDRAVDELQALLKTAAVLPEPGAKADGPQQAPETQRRRLPPAVEREMTERISRLADVVRDAARLPQTSPSAESAPQAQSAPVTGS
jgi:hypothetical protein